MKVKKYQSTLSLKPTQFSVGIAEVEYKVHAMKELKNRKLLALVEKTIIPVVLSPWNELCVVDHHHFLFACWHANILKVHVEVVEDLSQSKLSYHAFWKRMAAKKYAYLYDQFGDGPRSPLYLPDDVRGMADDPYRSLAWIVRKEGGFEKSDVTFAEFRWAGFFRKKRLLHKHGKDGLHDAVMRAFVLARSRSAKSLPGYIDPKKIEADAVKHLKEKKTKFIAESQTEGEMATVPNIKELAAAIPSKAAIKKSENRDMASKKAEEKK